MTHTWHNGLLIGAVAALILWWIIHRIRRTFEDRCSCGRLFQSVTYYLEPDPNAPYGILMGRRYGTYKFLRCSRRSCSRLRCHYRERYLTYLALWLKKTFKPWQFHRTRKIEAMIEEAFAAPRGSYRTSIGSLDKPSFIPPPHEPGRFTQGALLINTPLGRLLHNWGKHN